MDLSQIKTIFNAYVKDRTTTTDIISTSANYNNLDPSTTVTSRDPYLRWGVSAVSITVLIVGLVLIGIKEHKNRPKQDAKTDTGRQILESMCLGNTHAPPEYEEIIPNNQSMSELIVNNNPMHEHGAENQLNSETTGVTSDGRRTQHELTIFTAPHTLTVSAFDADHSITSDTGFYSDHVGLQRAFIEWYAHSMNEADF